MFNLILSMMLFITAPKTIYEFKIKSIDGKIIDLSQYKGKKILIVNSASQCGYTPQYEALQKLSETYKDKLVVLAFPANNFGEQEPGTDADIKTFCSKSYKVSFPMASKVSVKGNDINELFKWLTTQENPDFTGDINWNFEKFLIDENGKLIRRYRSKVRPLDVDILKQL